MIDGFIGVVLICQELQPTNCMVINGPIAITEQACYDDLMTNGANSIAINFPNTYIAGATCMYVELQDEPA